VRSQSTLQRLLRRQIKKKTPVISRYVSTHAKISNARTPGMHLQSDLSILEKFEETEICNYYF
jgi:hypothetical protein